MTFYKGMLLTANTDLARGSSRLWLAIALLISLFTLSGTVSSQPGLLKTTSTELIVTPKRRFKRSISLYSVLRYLHKKPHFYAALSYFYLQLLHKRQVITQLHQVRKSSYKIPARMIMPGKIIAPAADSSCSPSH
ncbi:MAG: hypothetical protein ACK4TA_14025 [Saprospiraceae bacterium]